MIGLQPIRSVRLRYIMLWRGLWVYIPESHPHIDDMHHGLGQEVHTDVAVDLAFGNQE